MTDDHLTSIEPVRAELKKLAESGRVTYYGELGDKVGRHARWPRWKNVLDKISEDSPDLSILVLNARSGWPGQIGYERVEGEPTATQKRHAQSELERVFSKYANGKSAPALPRPKR